MNEDFLHYLWKYRLFNKLLQTTEGETIEILSPGIHNHHAGPDFSDARLRIGQAMWAGNVEIHVNTSDWLKHGHQHDPAYDNVVLHVVYHHDLPGFESRIPVLQLRGFFDENLFFKYHRFIETRLWVPCAAQINIVPETDKALWLERMLIERLERKADLIHVFLETGKNNWEEALYVTLARSFGFNVNALPFEMLARSLPYKVIARHTGNPFQTEALILGQSGLLTSEVSDPTAQALLAEYEFLRKKYQLIPIAAHLWKFLRLRPVNFPTIRLSQFAALLGKHSQLLSKITSCKTIEELENLFAGVETSEYWRNHYNFDSKTVKKSKRLGHDAIHLILINAILPFIFVYGRAIDNDELCNRALDLYTKLPGEKNSITQNWEKAGMDTGNAFNTQALIGLKTSYCDKKRCLNCRIGNYLLRNGMENE